ncbi:phosphate signaling complex protein PhoU [Sphingomonas prati]|uniref:Phosphate-specific transport system accessory protein PhoU n=1 Tax=Sphingomonas prati TaxID=1843237 RepID=A0A7W9BU10_9SPHN|nr:phosphate signaling complex protein PhoU [Sphingomonas prati]MBB5730093.1 phosphate transport system protein [Sphingomonas prati]GGE91420.1 phosphate transport system regulatory protein PhoU [Sphingomonas prati]
MVTGHTVKAFDDELGQLRALVSEMGGLAEAAISEAIQSLVRRDLGGAARVVDQDRRIDEIEAQIEREVVRMIALRAPMADDLREILAAMKISSVIERIGDYAKNIAKRVPLLQDARGLEPLSILPSMARLVSEMVHNVLDAFVARDPKAALAVCESDRAVDDFYNSLFRTLLTYMLENPHTITSATHLLFIAKNLERIGDHATNVAEMVYFAATGRQMVERAKGDDTLIPVKE